MKKKKRILALEEYAGRIRKLVDEQSQKIAVIRRRLDDFQMRFDEVAPKFPEPDMNMLRDALAQCRQSGAYK